MNQPDRNPDQAVDHILQALGQTQPPRHLNQRILANLEARATSAEPRSRWSRAFFLGSLPRFAATGSAFALPLAAILIAAASLAAFHFKASPRPNASRFPEALASDLTGPATNRPLAPGAMSERLQASIHNPKGNAQVRTPGLAWGFSPTNTAHPIGGASAPGLPAAAVQTATANSTDPAYLPSFPAPPAPLTAEEKLLRRMVRHEPEVLLAELDLRDHHANLAPQRNNSDAFFSAFIPGSAPPPEPPTPSTDAAIITPDPAAQPTDTSSTDTTNGDQQ